MYGSFVLHVWTKTNLNFSIANSTWKSKCTCKCILVLGTCVILIFYLTWTVLLIEIDLVLLFIFVLLSDTLYVSSGSVNVGGVTFLRRWHRFNACLTNDSIHLQFAETIYFPYFWLILILSHPFMTATHKSLQSINFGVTFFWNDRWKSDNFWLLSILFLLLELKTYILLWIYTLFNFYTDISICNRKY